jgi:predicted nuclease of predicted toxin-antitoxin system
MLLYADEDFPFPVVEELRRLGHDVLTTQEDGWNASEDADILARAHSLGRVVVTHYRSDFERLHRQGAAHSGIVSATHDHGNHTPLAARIDAALSGVTSGRWTIRVNRPQKP